MIVLFCVSQKSTDSRNILMLPPRRTLSLSFSRDKKAYGLSQEND